MLALANQLYRNGLFGIKDSGASPRPYAAPLDVPTLAASTVEEALGNNCGRYRTTSLALHIASQVGAPTSATIGKDNKPLSDFTLTQHWQFFSEPLFP